MFLLKAIIPWESSRPISGAHIYFWYPLRCARSVVTLTRYSRFPVLTLNVNRPVFGHFCTVLGDRLVWYFIIFPFSLEGCNHVSVPPLPTSHWTSDAGGTGTDSRLAKVKLFTAHFRQLGQKSFLEKKQNLTSVVQSNSCCGISSWWGTMNSPNLISSTRWEEIRSVIEVAGSKSLSLYFITCESNYYQASNVCSLILFLLASYSLANYSYWIKKILYRPD